MDENRDREREVNRDVVDVAEERRDRDEGREEQVRENRAPAATAREELVPLFEDEDAKRFRNQWLSIQSKFVDDPRESVKQADDLVAGVLKSVTMGFSDRRVALEKQWNSGENISTEDLRVALKRYRSFFDRLLTLES